METAGLRAKHLPYPVRLRRGNFDWLGEMPEINHARLIVTVLDEPQKKPIQYRSFSIPEAEELEILGDIVLGCG